MKFRELQKHLKLIAAVAFIAVLMTGCSDQYMVLNPAGPVGREELHLIVLSTILVAIVIIPVLLILWFIVVRYRDKPGNTAKYTPNWEHSTTLEVIWWGIPIIIVAVLGFFTAKTTFTLTKPPVQNAKPIVIQVTSLNWKWLFTYPGQKIATVNYAEIPAGVPVQFELTADSPMNSFWVPQLGGQEYAMPGMDMRLWLQADKPGEYFGSGANFTGEGFAHMKFKVTAKSQADFNTWVNQVKQSAPALTKDGYTKLTQPGTANTMEFSAYPAGLFETIVNTNGGKYMQDMQDQMKNEEQSGSNSMSGMNMGQ